jgi:hypothetical protein
MRTPKYNPEKIRDLLRRAYQTKVPAEIDGHWETRLMVQIREIGPLRLRPRFLPTFERVVWRLVPVTTPLVLVMIALLIKLYLSSAPNAFQLFLYGAEELTLAQMFLG